ncbi:MAG TPA: helix-turn-helix transcriptional regulator [Eubacteriales bacterium]|nr:helix-turn-helix transcriptional regulator [Eubacteriales bacterium]
MNLNEKISKLRKQKGLSQEALAERLSVSRQAISKWETGESLPDMDNIAFLCKEFDVSADFLLNDTVENPNEFCVLQENGQTVAKKLTTTRIALICVSCVLVLALIFVGIFAFYIPQRDSTVTFFKEGEYISTIKISLEQETTSGIFLNIEILFLEQHKNVQVYFVVGDKYGEPVEYLAEYNGLKYYSKIYIRTKNLGEKITLKIVAYNEIFTMPIIDISEYKWRFTLMEPTW